MISVVQEEIKCLQLVQLVWNDSDVIHSFYDVHYSNNRSQVRLGEIQPKHDTVMCTFSVQVSNSCLSARQYLYTATNMIQKKLGFIRPSNYFLILHGPITMFMLRRCSHGIVNDDDVGSTEVHTRIVCCQTFYLTESDELCS